MLSASVELPMNNGPELFTISTSPALNILGRGCSSRQVEEGEVDQISVSPSVVDLVNAGRLWQLCEELTKARLD